MKKGGFLQALGVAAYCTAIGVFFWQANVLIGNPGIFAPILMLTLLSFSVLVCGLLVFYKPYKLFFGGKKNEAIDLVLSTTVWLFVFFVIVLITTWVTTR